MRTCLWAGAAALACLASGAAAQTQLPPVKDWAGRTVPGGAVILVDKDGRPITSDNPLSALPVQPIGRTEAVQLIAASTSTGAQTLLGGRYAFAQACLNYNGQAITLRYRGPDGTAMQIAAAKSSADTSLVEVPAGAVVDATVPSAAIGCNASITRIPQ